MAMKKVFTTGQVAKICKVAPRTVHKWFDSGRLKGYHVPGSKDRRIPREQLIRFLKEHSMPLGELEEEELFKVLLVGTSQLFAERLKGLLPESDDYRFEYAGSGFQAGSLLIHFAPNAIVLDFDMGRGECVAIASNVRGRDAYASTLLVGMASEDEVEPDKLKERGFDDVYKKPFDVAELAERVRSLADAGRDN